jgi:hypothetical protein
MHHRRQCGSLGLHQLGILPIEGISAKMFTDSNLEAVAPEVQPHIAVAINVLDNVSQLDRNHRRRHTAHLDQISLTRPSSSSVGNSSNAMSSRSRSHTARRLMRFGLGMRPSATI